MTISAKIVPLSPSTLIGDTWAVDTNRWNHLAIVNDNGTNTFYVNGIQHGASASRASARLQQARSMPVQPPAHNRLTRDFWTNCAFPPLLPVNSPPPTC